MQAGPLYLPHPPLYLLGLVLALGLAFVLVRYVLVGYVYERLGLSRGAAVGVLLAALVGSGINIPIARLPAERIVQDAVVSYFGFVYVIPRVVETGHTILAINVGGALIPLLLVGHLLLRYGASLRTLAAFVLVTAVVYALARPVPGVGVVLPALVPGCVAAAAAVLLDPWTAPRTAFIAGTMGTLVGADVLNLGRSNQLGAPVASVGGAGTFDGIFVAGVVAVLLAGLPYRWGRSRRHGRPRPAEPSSREPPAAFGAPPPTPRRG